MQLVVYREVLFILEYAPIKLATGLSLHAVKFTVSFFFHIKLEKLFGNKIIVRFMQGEYHQRFHSQLDHHNIEAVNIVVAVISSTSFPLKCNFHVEVENFICYLHVKYMCIYKIVVADIPFPIRQNNNNNLVYCGFIVWQWIRLNDTVAALAHTLAISVYLFVLHLMGGWENGN